MELDLELGLGRVRAAAGTGASKIWGCKGQDWSWSL